jgi:hypothetical protein
MRGKNESKKSDTRPSTSEKLQWTSAKITKETRERKENKKAFPPPPQPMFLFVRHVSHRANRLCSQQQEQAFLAMLPFVIARRKGAVVTLYKM